jgi:endonuclease YncB( thermonuclease family)
MNSAFKLKSHLTKATFGWLLVFIPLLSVSLYSHTAKSAQDCPLTHIDKTAKIKHVHDADTVMLQNGEKLRLIGINAPEVAKNDPRYGIKPAEPFGDQARDTLRRWIKPGDSVQIQYGIEAKDRFGRSLAHIAKDGTNLNARLLNEGLAFTLIVAPNIALSDCYRQQEEQAQAARRNLWSSTAYAPLSPVQLVAARDEPGMKRLQGTVRSVKLSGKRWYINFDNHVSLLIYSEDFRYFNGEFLKKLVSKEIEVHGWFKANKQWTNLKLSHPASIKLLR